ncbi:MAG TPA: glycosyl transferase [Clostridiaceae bacterium]|nr:glycosyl transferase [Clostridiaceae bacterium]
MTHVFIIGSKGIPANYGGFETFVDNLVSRNSNNSIKYHVSCLNNGEKNFIYNGAECFNVDVINIGSAKAILYDIKSLSKCINYIEKNNIESPIIYILACRIGPFLGFFKRRIKKDNIKICVNPDGHEWKRSKWNKLVKKYWKISEMYCVRFADLLICDSKEIEKYINNEYKQYKPRTVFIPYGAETSSSIVKDNSKELEIWHKKNGVKKNEYYLIVGRFVPENNFETMIREFMISKTEKDLVIITNIVENKFYYDLLRKTNFTADKRIKFVGTLYDKELIKKIRENAFAYIHGHEVGGTNPSLLEALASTSINILLDVKFNREVGQDAALYFNKTNGSLSELIDKVEMFSDKEIKTYKEKAIKRIEKNYTWDKVILQYEKIFE